MSSPSEFLTFYRRVATHPSIRPTRLATVSPYRAFSLSSRLSKDPGTNENVTDRVKKDDLDIQSNNSKKGQESQAAGTGGSATSGKDDRNSAQKTKEEFPEAPDTVIGMQDERGGKAH